MFYSCALLADLYPGRTDSSKHTVRGSVPAVYGGYADLLPSGETIAASENAAEITPAMLEALKHEQRFFATEDITMHLHPVLGGYMVWQTDLSQINHALRSFRD